MAKRLVICAVQGRSQANRIVGHLINGGFEDDSVSVLFADKEGLSDPAAKGRRGVSMMAKAGIGALLGGAFVWLGGTGVFSVPQLGSLVIAGAPLAAALGRLNPGGVAYALEGMGVCHDKARFYETSVKEGSILISVNVADDREALAASQIVRAIGVQDFTDTATAENFTAAPHRNGEELLQGAAGCQ